MKNNKILFYLIYGLLGSLTLSGIFYIDSTYANYRPNHDKSIGILISVIIGFPIGVFIGFVIAQIKKNRK